MRCARMLAVFSLAGTLMIAASSTAKAQSSFISPSSRWGGNVGVQSLQGPVGGYPNQIFPNSREPFVTGTLTYRLQAPGKRTLLQPELFTTIGSVLDYKDDNDNNYNAQNEGHSYFGMGIANRVAAYLPGGSSLYVGAGAGVFLTSSFHLKRDFSYQQGYYDQPYYQSGDYYATRLGFQLFAGLQMKRGLYTQAILQDLGSADAYHYRTVGLVIGYRR